MDDDRTHKTLDALGDLFLTGAEAGDKDQAEKARPDPLDVPGPFKLHPTATTTEPRQSAPRSRDRVGAARPPQRAVSREAHVEAVFLGNLPGFGGPWLTQYAHHLATAAGPIAVLHVDDVQIDLELIGAAAHRRDLDTLSRAADVPAEQGILATLDALAADHLPPLAAFILHLPDPLGDVSRTIAADLDNWTIVCSSDQAAVVSAYRWIKGLLEDESVNAAPHRIGLMVMGCDHATAQETSAKLSDTAGAFLDADIELIGSLKQMVPVQLRTLGSYEGGADVWPKLLRWLNDRASHDPIAAPPPPPEAAQQNIEIEPEPQPAAPPMSAIEMQTAAEEEGIPTAALDELPVDLTQVPVTGVEDERETDTPGGAPDSVKQFVERIRKPKKPSDSSPPPEQSPPEQSPAPQQPAQQTPQPVPAPQVAAVTDDEPDLAALVKDAHIAPLRARSPHDEQVQLGIDDEGRLQLLLRHTGEPDRIKDSLSRLAYVGHWAGLHAQLLQLTAPDSNLNPALSPAMHLFTEHGKAAAAMVVYVDPDTHLHLLQRIVVGDQSTWFCTALK